MDEELERLAAGVRIDTRGFAAEVAAMRAGLEGPLGDGAAAAGRRIEAALLAAVRSGKLGFEDLRRSAVGVLDGIAAEAIRGGVAALLGGGGHAGITGGIAGTIATLLTGRAGRATGGPVAPGVAYLVGERGPELFVPTASGRVETPPAVGGAREIRVAITVNAAGGEAPAALQRSARQVARAVKAALGVLPSPAGRGKDMAQWLATARNEQAAGVLTRFDPAYWTVNFPRPMMAAVTTPAPDAIRVDLAFMKHDDLAGLIWEAADRWDHPLLAYETARDFRGCRLAFRWRSAGVLPLDAVNGPVLTIEGRDAEGAPRAWYVRLWNYARGTGTDAEVAIDFAAADGGFLLPGEADPVFAGDVDRMFVSLVPSAYHGSDAPLPSVAEAWVELTAVRCDGPGAVLATGDVVTPEHGVGIASGYDDSYHLTPARLLRNALNLGYRGSLIHYVGMSHYFRLEALGGGYYVSLAGGVLNAPCAAWHRDFAARAATLGYEVIWSLSYELLDRHCWNDWKQRAADGSPALTGWEPPSTLLSPAHDGAMAYLRQVAAAFLAIGVAAGLAPRFQVGEPWWWTRGDGTICLYDASAEAAFAPAPVPSLRGPLDAAQRTTLDRAGACLAASTAALCAYVRAVAPGCETHLLTYLPTVLDPATPEARRANLPVGWASPAFDVLQLEDYDWVTAGDRGASRAAIAAATARLGYPAARQHYLAGFVLRGEEAAVQWPRIEAAAEAARGRGVARAFVWALPQVMRDGLVRWDAAEEDDMQEFDDVLFPLALGREAEVAPSFSTAVLVSAGGAEMRNAAWAEARTSYDVGPGVRSEADIAALVAFFRARMGPARGFRLRDPYDHEGADEAIGTGDGAERRFALVRHYGDTARRITRPVAGSVAVAVAGAATQGFAVEAGGWVVLDAAPAPGAAVTASFLFDVPVRFAEDRLSVQGAAHLAGVAASVPLVEIREAGAWRS